MAIQTHNAIRANGLTDGGKFKQGNEGGSACQFFFPCDDQGCIWQVSGADGGDIFIPGEAITHSVAGTGVIRGVTSGTAIIVQDQSSWSTSSGTVTGGTSGSTVAGANGTLYAAIHDAVGFRGYAPDACSYNASPLYLNVTAGSSYAPVGTAFTAPDLNSVMYAGVVERNTTSGSAICSLYGTGSMKLSLLDDGADLTARFNDGSDNYDAVYSDGSIENDSTVHSFAIVLDRTNATIDLWLDGVEVASASLSGAGTFDSLTNMDLGPATNTDTDFYALSLFIFSDGVPSDIDTWLSEFKTNITGSNTQGGRKLPNRWAAL